MKIRVVILLVQMFFLPLSATAAEPVSSTSIDFTKKLIDEHGINYPMCTEWAPDGRSCKATRSVELSDIAIGALNARNGDVSLQIILYKLEKSIAERKPLDLDASAKGKIIEAVWAWRQVEIQRGDGAPLYEFGQAVEMIDPASVK